MNTLAVLAGLSAIPVEASPDLWPRVSKWLAFIHIYWEYLPSNLFAEQIQACLLHTSVILALAKHHQTSMAISQTRGVRRVLSIAWKAMVSDDSDFDNHGAYQRVVDIVGILVQSKNERGNFEEIMEAVGGNIEDLATTVSHHFRRGAYRPGQTPDNFVEACFSLFSDDRAASLRLQEALRAGGIVPILMTTIAALYKTAFPVAVHCLLYLSALLKHPPGYPYVREAFANGFLGLVVVLGAPIKHRTSDTLCEIIYQLLHETLPRALVHHTVLSPLPEYLPPAKVIAVQLSMKNSIFYDAWEALSKLMEARMEALSSWKDSGRPSYKGCNNMQCGKIGLQAEFRCCGRCRSAVYCSKPCQVTDWKAGHKTACRKLQLVRLQCSTVALTTRVKSFMRALLTADYRRRIRNICVSQIMFMYRNPGQAFLTTFSYTEVDGVRIKVESERILRGTNRWRTEYTTMIERGMQSEGRLEPHLMIFYEGDTVREVLSPMRVATSALYDELRRIARTLPELQITDVRPYVQKEVERFFLEFPDLQMVH
ncbi:hypothetical protein C8R43DRAFT_1136692 [Mycena crocata]|nr:hypothetical protein C8R43DRAFT_1136692 [Mycena crocata]